MVSLAVVRRRVANRCGTDVHAVLAEHRPDAADDARASLKRNSVRCGSAEVEPLAQACSRCGDFCAIIVPATVVRPCRRLVTRRVVEVVARPSLGSRTPRCRLLAIDGVDSFLASSCACSAREHDAVPRGGVALAIRP